MRKMLRQALVVAAFSVVVFIILVIVKDSGLFLYFHKHYPGKCRAVRGIQLGSEDFGLTSDGFAFISSGFVQAAMSTTYKDFLTKHNIRGRIYLFDFNHPDQDAVEVKIDAREGFDLDSFHPHGVSLLEDTKTGQHLLYVINHFFNGKDEPHDRVEKFRFSPQKKALIHVKSITDPMFQITNDLVVTAEDRFYITNYLYFHNHYLHILEHLLPIAPGAVLFYNGSQAVQVTKNIHLLNGITMAKDGSHVYVVAAAESSIHVYSRNAKDGSLTLLQAAHTKSGADNMFLSDDGTYMVTCHHPIMHKIAAYLLNPALETPSSVIKIPLKDGLLQVDDMEELLYDHGKLISGGTSAYIHISNGDSSKKTSNDRKDKNVTSVKDEKQKKLMLIGSIIHRLLLCDVDSEV